MSRIRRSRALVSAHLVLLLPLTLATGVSAALHFSEWTTPITAGRTRANNGILGVSQDGTQSITIQNDSAGPVDVLLDVSGFLQ